MLSTELSLPRVGSEGRVLIFDALALVAVQQVLSIASFAVLFGDRTAGQEVEEEGAICLQ